MKWISESDLEQFFSKYNYDIRLSKNGRWIDQKCTPDVLSFIADCIVHFVERNGTLMRFTVSDIWNYDYSIQNAVSAFNKPRPDIKAAQNEYDKFFGQPIKLLGYSKVLIEENKNGRNYYRVNCFDLLEYISFRENNALLFLQVYIEKVLRDSALFECFNCFFNNQTPDEYIHLKSAFHQFTKSHTKITGDLECGRIFTKVINPLAYKYHKCGTEKGHLSKDIISVDMLMYNRDNFRDIYLGKPKGVTRQEYCLMNGIRYNEGYGQYSSEKAKRYIRIFNDTFRNGISEVYPEKHTDPAIQMHHIFPQSSFPELGGYLENLIALTPNQHYIQAHPMGRTSVVDKQYQLTCLLCKAFIIYETIKNRKKENIYSFKKFLYVLDTGFDTDIFMNFQFNQFNDLINALNSMI